MKKLLIVLSVVTLVSCSSANMQVGSVLTEQKEAAVFMQDQLANCPALDCKEADRELYVWEEPMVDVVEVPAGLDPEGIYYRPAHKQVIEVRQGKWRYVK